MHFTMPATLSASTSAPVQTIYLKDYQAPSYAIDKTHLLIEIDDALHAKVTATLTVHRLADADPKTPLVLYGRGLELLGVWVDDSPCDIAPIASSEGDRLEFFGLVEQCVLQLVTAFDPAKNTDLEGLYLAKEGDEVMLVTQCEPQGFRKITYFADHPDILSVFCVEIQAPMCFGTLLSNGELIESGYKDGRRFAIWHDPIPKSAYLFACVVADLAVVEDTFTTFLGQEVLLQIYVHKDDLSQTHIAMTALKDAIRFDETRYRLPYDLSRFMIVAVKQFNMGAMENKGLNIFNSSCILADERHNTDDDITQIRAIIAHEYFHNYSGNRVTCRDWFQLCLKEGLTVYRDQSFTSAFESQDVCLINNVALIQSAQFAEDASLSAHPPRPESFVEINNFYTATVYEKGAQIVRMLARFMGQDAFLRGCQIYFAAFDKQAVTVEDFLWALGVVDARALDFLPWYRAAGTPRVKVDARFLSGTLHLTLTQMPATRAQNGAYQGHLPIPFDVGVFDKTSGALVDTRTLYLTGESLDARFDLGSNAIPVLSLLRNFSAPVHLLYEGILAPNASHDVWEDDVFLLGHDPLGFEVHQSAKRLKERLVIDAFFGRKSADKMQRLADALLGALMRFEDDALRARLLDMPALLDFTGALSGQFDPAKVETTLQDIKTALATHLMPSLLPILQESKQDKGARALHNAILGLGVECKDAQTQEALLPFARALYAQDTMTQTLGGLRYLVRKGAGKSALLDFYHTFAQKEDVLDRWFGVQADNADTAQDVRALIGHPRYDLGTPNRVRSVWRQVARLGLFWQDDIQNIYFDTLIVLDAKNPILAARMLAPYQHLVHFADASAYIKRLHALADRAQSVNVRAMLQTLLEQD